MMKKLAKRLSPDNTIGVLCVSDHMVNKQEHALKKAISFFSSMGFAVEVAQNISSPDPKKRAGDFNGFFKRQDICAIISIQGGNTSTDTLKFVDWQAVTENPKIFMGLSDITVYLNAIYKKTGLVTFHGGDMLSIFSKMENSKYNKTQFIERFSNARTGLIAPNGERKTIRGGKFSGVLLGGNLRCLLKLANTEFFPDFTNGILFLESLNLTPSNCRLYFNTLKKLKVFNKIKGVIIGFVYGMEVLNPTGEQMEDIIYEYTDLPILKIRDFGHNIENTALPLGVNVEVDADERTIKIVESFLS